MHYLHTKETAKKMRKSGASFGDISKKLHVAKSTLSFWFKDIILKLKEGTTIEKRELLANLRSRIIYKDKMLTLL